LGDRRVSSKPDPDPRAAAISFGIDPVQFGLIMIFNLILGTIHRPSASCCS
jgi:TRAP-type C4-dicarboxylate transport system permease large subunit